MYERVPKATSLLVLLKVYLSSDHITEATGKTVAVTISKNGGSFGNPNAGATNATEIASGWYKVTLDTTDTGTEGPLIVRGTATSCDNSEAVYDVVKATNGGYTALPDAAANANGGVPILSVSGTTLGYTISTCTMNTDMISAAGVRSAVGLASANLDTQLSAIAGFIDTEIATLIVSVGSGLNTLVTAVKAKTDNLPASPAATGDPMTLTSGERNSVADALLDRTSAIEMNITPRLAFRYIAAACAGKLSGAGTATEVFMGVGVSTDRLTATVDSSGNRSAITLG